jgi:hypothetical protein
MNNNVMKQILAEVTSSPIRETGTIQLLKSVISNADKLGISWHMRPGETVEPDPTTGATRVLIDGSDTAIPAMSLIGQVAAGSRVMVMVTPPSGNHIVGCIDADAGEWYQPTLINGYANRPGAQPLSLRLLANPPRCVQVVGTLIPGTIAYGIAIAILPARFLPKSTAVFPVAGKTNYERVPHMEVSTDTTMSLWHMNSDEYIFINAIYTLDL